MYNIIYRNGRHFVYIPVSTSLVPISKNKDILNIYNCSNQILLYQNNIIQYNYNTKCVVKDLNQINPSFACGTEETFKIF